MTVRSRAELAAIRRNPVAGSPLAGRERQVLALIAAGYTNPQIAKRLFLAVPTVADNCKRIFRKLDAPNRAAAVDRGWRLGLLGPTSLPETTRRPG